jgi:Domain of unknown function (DUF4159)
MSTKLFITILLLTSLLAALAHAQSFRRHIEQNDPPPTEFIAARWRFGTNGWFGHRGWSHNYPASDQNLNVFLERTTLVDVDAMSYRIVELGSDEVFEYPFAYVSEPGEMALTDQEVVNLREFVNRGGFVLMDDFDGHEQLNNMRSQVRRAFPDRDFVPITLDHPVFRVNYFLDDLAGMAEFVPGGHITYLAMLNDRGEIAILAGHNNDLANFWEWYDQPDMPLKPAADAFRLGANAVIYALTH